jgi:nucleoside-diphosphate-sugar epimerase
MRVLVTGAAGFLGSHLCDKLLSEGHKVWGIDNFFRGKKENLPNHPNFNFLEKDLSKENFDIPDIDIIFHYAAINGTRYFYDIPNKVVNDNIKITQNVLDSITPSVKKVIYASSSEVYGPKPTLPTDESHPIELHIDADRDSYASSKAIGEFMVKTWCKQNNVSYIILRPFNTYGTRMATNGYGQVIPELIERVNSDEEFFIFGDGSQTRSFCYALDHVNIAINLMNSCDNEVLNIGNDEEITIEELSKKILKLYNSNKKINNRPEWSNDTKWRRPSLVKLKKYITNYTFTSLEEGLNKLKNAGN